MHTTPADAVATLLGVSGVAVFLLVVALAVFWPLMALSAVRSLSKIRRELERINNTLESKHSIG